MQVRFLSLAGASKQDQVAHGGGRGEGGLCYVLFKYFIMLSVLEITPYVLYV